MCYKVRRTQFSERQVGQKLFDIFLINIDLGSIVIMQREINGNAWTYNLF